MIVTTEARIPVGSPFARYLDRYAPVYNSMLHKGFKCLVNMAKGTLKLSPSGLNTLLQQEYDVTKRAANSAIYDAKSILNSQEALLDERVSALESRLQSQKNKVARLEKDKKEMAQKAGRNELTEAQLETYRRMKRTLYREKNRLDSLDRKLKNAVLSRQNHDISVCFGTKKLFKAQYFLAENGYENHEQWLRDFRSMRNRHIFLVGSGDETQGNQQFQLTFLQAGEKKDEYRLQIRPELESLKKHAGIDYTYFLPRDSDMKKEGIHELPTRLPQALWLDGTIRVSYMRNELRKALRDGKAISGRILRRDERYYVQIMFDLAEPPVTTISEDMMGIDFNDGFLALAKSNHAGQLSKVELVKFKRLSSSGQAEAEMEEKVSRIVKEAKEGGYGISIESLDFRKKKQMTGSGYAKRYNRMLHSLPYSRFHEIIQRSCARNGVRLIQVNPAYTSRAGRYLYCKRKLNVHTAAAFVISHLGQGNDEDIRKYKQHIEEERLKKQERKREKKEKNGKDSKSSDAGKTCKDRPDISISNRNCLSQNEA